VTDVSLSKSGLTRSIQQPFARRSLPILENAQRLTRNGSLRDNLTVTNGTLNESAALSAAMVATHPDTLVPLKILARVKIDLGRSVPARSVERRSSGEGESSSSSAE